MAGILARPFRRSEAFLFSKAYEAAEKRRKGFPFERRY
jgi:hypothetical protein